MKNGQRKKAIDELMAAWQRRDSGSAKNGPRKRPADKAGLIANARVQSLKAELLELGKIVAQATARREEIIPELISLGVRQSSKQKYLRGELVTEILRALERGPTSFRALASGLCTSDNSVQQTLLGLVRSGRIRQREDRKYEVA